MILVSVTQAKAQLSHLLVLAEQGERVVITRWGKPIAELCWLNHSTQTADALTASDRTE